MAVLRRDNPNQKWDDLKKSSADARRNQDREAWLNLAFYHNEQWASWATLRDGTGRLLPPPSQEELPLAERTQRPVINKIMHFVNQQLAQSMQAKPSADVLAASSDYLSKGDADVANAYVRHLQEPNVGDWESVLWNANLWALVANEAYIKWAYDPVEKRPYFQFVPSVDIYSDPYVRDFYKARWVIHSQFMDPEQVYDVYNHKVQANRVEKRDQMRTQMMSDMGQAPVENGVTVNELWHMPSRRYPDGLFRVWSGKEVLHEEEGFPYEHGQLPFTQIGVIPLPNSKHYASPVTFLRAPQVELNKYHAQRLMTRETWANIKLWLPDDVELKTPWDDSPNQILRGSSSTGARPEYIMPPGPMPDNNDGEWLASEMGDVVGIHEVSEGQVPGRVEAAKAIELLRESDTSRLAVLLATQSRTISKGWYQSLMLARQYVTDEIVVETYSPEGAPEVKRFMSGQFSPGMRIRVTTGSGLANSRAARLDQLTVLWEKGILRDPEEFSRLADIPVSSTISTRAQDVLLARNENLTMQDSIAVQCNSWDDHTIHIREHNSFRKTAQFQELDEVEQARFEFHVEQHKKFELKKLQEDAQKAMLVQQALGQVPGQQGGEQPAPAPGQMGGEDTLTADALGE